MSKKILILLVFIASSFNLLAQNVVVNEPLDLANVMTEFESQSKAQSMINGWRIQIITTDNRRKMEAAKTKFETMFPDMYLKWDHIVPYYKIKVGAYKTKLELQAFLKELRPDFPSAIPIPDKIKKTQLVQY